MTDLIGLIMSVGVPIVLLILGFVVGRIVERTHLAKLDRRERELFTIPLTDLKQQPPGIRGCQGTLVSGTVVIGSDYFKTFAAGLRKLVGGEIRSFERMMERARREAICRLMEEAHAFRAVAVMNVRIEMSNIGGVSRSPTPMVEVLAYGTAILPAHG